ncbi:MAG: head-tail adaptor protein [Rhodobacter sp.]|nr:head-tail adaptor protein [Rhodobacter sp.]
MAAAGRFRDQARFERQGAATLDDAGNTTESWGEVATVWADLMETPGQEGLAAGRPEETKTGTLRVRNSATMRGITGADRVIVRSETWDILSSPSQVGRAPGVLEFKVETGRAEE